MKYTLFLIGFIAFCVPAAFSQTAAETAVEQTVAALSKAMVDADSAALDRLTMAELSYGHSGGTVQDKKDFIAKILDGKSDFVSIDITDQSIVLVKNTAIVRHMLNAITNDSGKPGEIHLKVLLVFEKNRGAWKLLARQAVKPH